MAIYQLTSAPNVVRRKTDGAYIPMEEGNRDFTAYQAWLAAGNAPDPAEVPVRTAAEQALTQLQADDQLMFRALEVLIDVLLTKGVIVPADFPVAVRAMYNRRKALRAAAGV